MSCPKTCKKVGHMSNSLKMSTMKKTRMILGVMALSFAFISSFAFNDRDVEEVPAFRNIADQCIKVEGIHCEGSQATCKRQVAGELRTLYQFNSVTSCSPELKMNTP